MGIPTECQRTEASPNGALEVGPAAIQKRPPTKVRNPWPGAFREGGGSNTCPRGHPTHRWLMNGSRAQTILRGGPAFAPTGTAEVPERLSTCSASPPVRCITSAPSDPNGGASFCPRRWGLSDLVAGADITPA